MYNRHMQCATKQNKLFFQKGPETDAFKRRFAQRNGILRLFEEASKLEQQNELCALSYDVLCSTNKNQRVFSGTFATVRRALHGETE